YAAGIVTNAMKVLFRNMYEDGLIKNIDERFKMKYGVDGIVVNGKKLEGEQNIKYRAIFRDVMGLDLNNDKISGNYNMGDLRGFLSEYDTSGDMGMQDEDNNSNGLTIDTD